MRGSPASRQWMQRPPGSTLVSQVRCPVVHEKAPPLEQVRAPVRRLDDFPRMVGPFGGPLTRDPGIVTVRRVGYSYRRELVALRH